VDGERLEVLLASQGDHGAFEALVAPRRARLLLLLAAVLGDWHEAEDALQEALWPRGIEVCSGSPVATQERDAALARGLAA